ncbi:MAG: DUF1732 domain-containing protein [Candidatus Cloacimonadota bacterium]|nr:DUF1732 domain-containing protein [Candidatus Cloacimonadota bacterium]
MNSMTGFGSLVEEINGIKFRITIKSINDKFLTVKCKIPEEFSEYITYKIENAIPNFIDKGRVYIKIQQIDQNQNIQDYNEIKERLEQFSNIFKEISKENFIKPNVSVRDLIYIQNSLNPSIAKFETDEFINEILKTVKKVVNKLIIERKREGDNLEEFFIKSINQIEVSLSTIQLSIPKFLVDLKRKVNEKLNELYKYDTELNKFNEDRIIKEITFYIDKSDITEEIVRLKSHLDKFHQLITVTDEPIGDSMNFIIQEMQREISTISAKYNNPDVFSEILKIKSEIQKCKEQARNVE